MSKDVKISNHAKMKYIERCFSKYHFRKLVIICNNIRDGRRSVKRVVHYKNTYNTKCCYYDYKEKLVFVFSDTMKRLLTVRNDAGHFGIANTQKNM